MHEPDAEKIIAEECGLSTGAVSGIIGLLDNGATVPFIARYRKEQTASSDEEQIRAVRDRLAQIRELETRRTAILSSLRERELLSEELARAIDAATTKAELEDVYLPYRPKRLTRGRKAREAGLEPLADSIHAIAVGRSQPPADTRSLAELAAKFVTDGAAGGGESAAGGKAATRGKVAEGGEAAAGGEAAGGAPRVVPDPDAAIAGARDILAERASEDGQLRGELRNLFARRAHVRCSRARGVDRDSEAAGVYRDYFEHDEPVSRVRYHRLLAMLRGEREGVLNVHVLPEEEQAMALVRRRVAGHAAGAQEDGGARRGQSSAGQGSAGSGDSAERGQSSAGQGSAGAKGASASVREACRAELDAALTDGWKRLLSPSLETEFKATLQESAEQAAAEVFARNLSELLLSAPMGGRRMLAVDPGLRTGCKVVCLDEHGDLLHHETIYPLAPKKQIREAGDRVRSLCEHYRLEVMAVGNGTGGREAQSFLRELGLTREGGAIPVISVNEAGASVYSASRVAKQEFPEQDVTVRGAISIGRRLMDPLAELVKIDPKSIGVGQYQHDVDEKLLDARLSDTVVSCVNAVGADLNTASAHLLRYVAGLNAKRAEAVVTYRRAAGGFHRRRELKKVPGLGPRSYEQAAGFLRVHGEHPLDATAVHPERYALVERMAGDLGVGLFELVGNETLCKNINLKEYVDTDVGMPTLQDIVVALAAPGRDPRPEYDVVEFREDVTTIEDLREGMKLDGVVTNITDFGAFVDIGVHRDGLVHISRLADRYVKDPHEVVSVGAAVTVTVVGVESGRGRISLSMTEG